MTSFDAFPSASAIGIKQAKQTETKPNQMWLRTGTESDPLMGNLASGRGDKQGWACEMEAAAQ